MKYAFAVAAVLFGAMSLFCAFTEMALLAVVTAGFAAMMLLGVAIKTSHAGTQTKARVEAAQEVA